MTCPDCERYKESAKNWRHKAYELSGHPLPWEGGDTWVGLTREEFAEILCDDRWQRRPELMLLATQAKLKEKNDR